MKVALLKLLDATVGFMLCWTVGWLRYLAGRHASPTPTDALPAPVRRVLVVRPGGMGDMVLLLPVLRALRTRFPGAVVHLICEKRNRDILRMAGVADDAILYDAHPLRLLGIGFRERYDIAIDTEQFHYFSALMALLGRAPVRIGFKITPGRNLLYTHLVNYDLGAYEADQFARLLAPLGIDKVGDVAGCLEVAPDALPADRRRQIEALAAQPGLIVVHAGSTSRYKLWEPEKIAGVMMRLAESAAWSFVLVGSKDERSMAELVLASLHLGDRVVSLVGAMTLAETAAVLQRATLFIGGDSGLAHMAVALRRPTVVWFGPSDSRKWGVNGPSHAVVSKALACAPCFIFGYHKLCRHIACMRSIAVDDVLQACRDVLAAGTTGPA